MWFRPCSWFSYLIFILLFAILFSVWFGHCLVKNTCALNSLSVCFQSFQLKYKLFILYTLDSINANISLFLLTNLHNNNWKRLVIFHFSPFKIPDESYRLSIIDYRLHHAKNINLCIALLQSIFPIDTKMGFNIRIAMVMVVAVSN